MNKLQNNVILSASSNASSLMEHMLLKGEVTETQAIEYFIYVYDNFLIQFCDKWGVEPSSVIPTDDEIINLSTEVAKTHVKGSVKHYQEFGITDIVDGFINNFYNALWSLCQKYKKDYSTINITPSDLGNIAMTAATLDMKNSLDIGRISELKAFNHSSAAYDYAIDQMQTKEKVRRRDNSSLRSQFH